MEISKELLKEKAEIIGNYVEDLIKSNKFTNKQIADILKCNENTISQKNHNKNGKYYNLKDLEKLAELFNCSIAKLTFTEFYNIDENNIFYEKDYLYKINYLHSIGLHFQPAFFWVGTDKQFKKAQKIIAPYLSPVAKKRYKLFKNNIEKNIYMDEIDYISINLLLTDNPLKDFNNISLNNVKTTFKDNIYTLSRQFLYKYFSNSNEIDEIEKDYKKLFEMGYIEIKFILFENDKKQEYYKLFTYDDLLKIFDISEKIIKSSILALIDNPINKYDYDF